ncbi:hypothetical protein LMH87_001132 [Akanthomyces muscarius]|uniref:Uncharacterized protein n=1 Tax=Akanthomyces muscarius TaxID=2231603 RepID=A0A9W8QFX6_AKAMU|nr:hypothetical protein LMH87_001132 [Akanthomyces muscarius]KAJ4155909.1 hypothetical protein LMH87_001132 [Akanthomyces muscarius]
MTPTSPCGGYICGASLNWTPHRTRGLLNKIAAFNEPKLYTQEDARRPAGRDYNFDTRARHSFWFMHM